MFQQCLTVAVVVHLSDFPPCLPGERAPEEGRERRNQRGGYQVTTRRGSSWRADPVERRQATANKATYGGLAALSTASH